MPMMIQRRMTCITGRTASFALRMPRTDREPEPRRGVSLPPDPLSTKAARWRIDRTMTRLLLALALAAPLVAAAREPSAAELAHRTVQRRAVEAAIWGTPIVSTAAMRQSYFRDANAEYGDILYWSKPADWRFQFTTPNASSRYVYFNYNLKDGPVVLEVPPAAGAGLFGTLADAWQVPLVEVGPAGEDRGKGGKYVVLPPDWAKKPPAGYVVVRSETFNGYGLLRAVPATSSDTDVEKALALVKRLRLYPLADAGRPPEQKYIDVSGQLLDGVVRWDASFYDVLAGMIDEEPVATRDLVAMALVRSLGIEKGAPFEPDAATRDVLAKAAAEVHESYMQRTLEGDRFWPRSRWLISVTTGPKTDFTFQTTDRLEIDERGFLFFLAFAPPKKLGAATVYVAGVRDAAGEPLQGDRTYRLHVPPNVPVKQFWSVTVYDSETACFFPEAPRVTLDSYDQKAQKNADGSIDVYFGPTAPPGKEANWVWTPSGKRWFTFFRFYGPEPAVFDKTWVLGDLERVPR
jgi:hypothetical protein